MAKNGKNLSKVLTASICVALLGSFAFAGKAKSPELVKEEAGYYYGYGKGSTKEAAELAGKKDLVENALTATLRSSNPKASRVTVSEDSASERLSSLKVWKVNDKASTDVVYRIKTTDWDKEESAFAGKMRSSLTSKVSGLSEKGNIAEKINDAVAILGALASSGETELLTVDNGTELISRKVEAACKNFVGELQFELSTKDGVVNPQSKFSVKVSDASGKPVAKLKIRAVWSISSILPSNSEEELPEVAVVLTTDNSGNAVIDYPASDDFHNKSVVLTVSTAFSESAQATLAMKKLDVASSVDGCYVHFDDVKAAFKSAAISAGEFNAGAVSQDNIGSKNAREASRKVKTGAYSMLLTPVTNAEFAAYLHATRAETLPEYMENSAYNQPTQPVVGVSISDAENYATWLSEQTGETYRLPTEEEWEKAARAGKDVIYPWGDDDPKKAKAANFKGNGKFKTTSPVGSFEAGNNELGLVDMSGNVWEWTSSTHTPDSAMRITKGGSYLDGPKELRISNYKDRDGANGYADVGFRLVKEVTE